MFSLKLIPSKSLSLPSPGTEIPVPITNGALGVFDGPLPSILPSSFSGFDAFNGET